MTRLLLKLGAPDVAQVRLCGCMGKWIVGSRGIGKVGWMDGWIDESTGMVDHGGSLAPECPRPSARKFVFGERGSSTSLVTSHWGGTLQVAVAGQTVTVGNAAGWRGKRGGQERNATPLRPVVGTRHWAVVAQLKAMARAGEWSARCERAARP